MQPAFPDIFMPPFSIWLHRLQCKDTAVVDARSCMYVMDKAQCPAKRTTVHMQTEVLIPQYLKATKGRHLIADHQPSRVIQECLILGLALLPAPLDLQHRAICSAESAASGRKTCSCMSP